MALTNSQPNNISVPNGNGLVVYIDGLTNQVYVRDVKGSIEELNVLTESITTIIATGGLTQLKEGSVVTLGTDSTIIQLKAEKGQANGYASLDASGKLPVSELPVSVLTYEGLWNAATNTPTLADGVGDPGDFYIVSVGGTQDLGSGPIRFEEGDWVIYSGNVWQENSSQIADLQEVTDVGATTTNAITTGGITTDFVQMDTTATPTLAVGMARFNPTQLTWELGMGSTALPVTLGQSLYYPLVRNTSGGSLPKGTLVMVDTADVSTSDRLNVKRAIANGTVVSQLFVGVLAEAIANNATGFAIWFGQVDSVALSAINLGGQTWAEGDILYADPTNPGGLSNVEPTAPNAKVTIATLLSIAGSNVNLLVRPWLTQKIGQLNDVAIISPIDNSILQYNSTTGVWENVAGTTTNIAEGTNLYFTTARARESVSATDGLAYNSTTGVFTNIDKGSSQDIFKNVAVATQSTITADNNNDTLTLVAGTNMAITTNDATDTITFATTGVPTGAGLADYLALWTTSSNLGTSLIYDNGTNIGINTPTPFSDGANTNSLTIQGVSGAAIQLQTNNLSGLKMSTSAAGSLAGDVRNLNFDLVANNAAKLGVLATGTIRLYDYGTGTKTGTPTFNLFVDTNGNIIEGPGGVIDGSGTTNFVAKFTDANTIGDSTIFDNGTSVGIGTITPIGILDLFKSAATTRFVLNGDAGFGKIITYRVGGLQRFGLYVNNTAESGGNAGSDFAIRAYADAGTLSSTPFFIKRATGNIVLNSTTDAGFKLDVHGTSKFRSAANFDTDITVNGLIVGRSGGDIATNVAIGRTALDSNTTGTINTAVGEKALTSNSTGSANSAFGNESLRSITTGSSNTGVGDTVLLFNTNGSFNSAFGAKALQQGSGGSSNTAIGSNALFFNSASNNTAVGAGAAENNTTGNNVTAIGVSAAFKNTTGTTLAVGASSLFNNTTGTFNVAIGNNSLQNNVTGGENSALGTFSLNNNTVSNQVAIGYSASQANTTGANNTSLGHSALISNTTGANNVALGSSAGRFLANGSTALGITNNSVFLGVDSRANANDETNQIVIGHLAIGGGSNSVVIGNSSITSNRFFGTMRVGTINNGVGDFITTDANGVLTKRTAAETRTDIGAGTGDGSVTSVAMTVPTGFAISGTPITVSGTLGLTFAAGFSLPSDATQAEWTTSYNESITAFAYNTGTALLTLTQRDLGTLTATITLQPFTTTNLAEGTNLYFTDARARLALSAGTGISYVNSTGVITNSDLGSSQNIFKNIAVTGSELVVADTNDDTVTFTAGSGVTITSVAATDTITISATGLGGTVTSVSLTAPTGFAVSGSPVTTSGTLSLGFDTGFSLPTNASQANWDDSYNNKITAASFGTGTGTLTLTQQDTGTLTTSFDGRYILLSEKAAANGVATLDGSGKIPSSQLPSSVFEYKGLWNAATNTPTLADGTGDPGDVYQTSVAGTVNFGSGPVTFAVGDLVIYDGTEWQKSDSTSEVLSVNSQVGVVVLTTTDIGEGTNLYFTDARARTAISGGTGISYNSTTGTITNSDLGSSQNIFKNFEVAGQSTVVADINNDTLTLVAGTNISITTSNTTDTITFNSTDQFVGTVTSVGMSAPTGFTVSGTPVTSSGTLGLAFASGYSLPTDAIQGDWTTSYNRSLTAFAYNTSTGALTLTKQDTTTLVANVTLAPFSTTNLAEGTNLYFTDARARLAIALTTTGTSGLSTYNSTTGVLNIPNYQGAITNPVTGTGTTNFVPKWTSASAIGNSQIFDDGTNIGIGTSSPTSLLTLNGTTPFIRIERTGVPTWQIQNNTLVNDAGFSINNVTNATTPFFINGTTDNVGINTANPAFKFNVITNAVAGRQNLAAIDRTAQNFVTFTNPQFSADASMGIMLRVFPQSDARQGAGIIASGGSNNATTDLDLFVTTSPDGTGGTTYSALKINGINGNVGIGTTAPAAPLHVKNLGDNGGVRYTVFLGQNSTGYQNSFVASVQDELTDLGAGIVGTNTGSNLSLSTHPNGSALTERMRITKTGNVLINTTTDSGFKLDVNGTGRFIGNLLASVNQNDSSTITISNTTAGASAQSTFQSISDTTAGSATFGKFSSSNSGYKIIAASNAFLYTDKGDIAILNDNASGTIKLAAGGSSSAHLTIASTGAATFSNALQVAGQQAAANYGGTGLNFDFTSGNIGRIASVKTTSGGSQLQFLVYNNAGSDISALGISSTGAATFSSSVTANGSINGFQGATHNLLIDFSSESQVTTLTNTNLFFGTNAQRRMTITAAGLVGIGVTNPVTAKLEVFGGIPTLFTADSQAASATYGGSIFYRNTKNLDNGNGISFALNNASDTLSEYGYIGGLIETNTAGSNNGAIIFVPTLANARIERMRIASSGAIRFNAYGAGTITGTPAFNLAVDSSGNIIETAGAVVDGSGTTNYVSKWTDSNTIGNSQIFDTGSFVTIGSTTNDGNGLTVNDVSTYRGIGIATSTASARPTISFLNRNTAQYGSFIQDINGALALGRMNFDYGGHSEFVRITNGGNFLIGTTTDSGEKLVVNGTIGVPFSSTIRVAGGGFTRNDIITTGYNNISDLKDFLILEAPGSSSGKIILGTSGYVRVGIGTNAPASGLVVSVSGSKWDSDNQYNQPAGNIFSNLGFCVADQENWIGMRGAYNSTSGSANLLLQANFRDIGSNAGHYVASQAISFGNAEFVIGRLQTQVSVSTAPAKVEQFRLYLSGQLKLNLYGAGTFTGTPAFNLAVDSSGNIIETAGGVVDGSGTANTITKWQDANTVTNSSITDDGTTVTATAANFVSQSNLGTAYTSFTTSGTTAIFDTITRTNSAIYQIVIVANPNTSGSGAYADFYYGKVIIGTGFNGSAVVDVINYHQESPMPRGLYGSGGGDLTVTAVMLVGGSEVTEVAVNASYTIRIKIAGYVVAGGNTTVRLQRIM